MNAIPDGMARGISASYCQGSRGNVGRVNYCAWQFRGECDGEAAGARADVGNLKTIASGFLRTASAQFPQSQAIKRDLDDVFSFRPGNKDIWIHFKFQIPEFLFAGE